MREMMKKLGFACILCFSLALLNAWGNATFNGSSTGNDTQFIMEYSILNTSDHRSMPLKTGDVIDTTVVSDDGSVDIQVENSEGEPSYSETGIPLLSLKLWSPKTILTHLLWQDTRPKEA